MLILSVQDGMTSPRLTVAIVDDDETVRRALRRMISSPFLFASGI
jgi:FixJ family two-component response regulator